MPSYPEVILATSSRFRQSLFKEHFPNLVHENPEKQFISPKIDERAIRDPNPETMVRRIAEAKCDAVLKSHGEQLAHSEVVLTCDEIVLCDGQVREKPKDRKEAERFLKSYQSGTKAICLNGLVAHHISSGKRSSRVDKSWLSFKAFSDETLRELLENPIFLECAGGFCVDLMGVHLDQIEGSVNATEGFPVEALRSMMSEVTPDLTDKIGLRTFSKEGIKAVLFDMDGLLLDTERFYTIAQQKILDRFNIQFTWEVKSMMMGRKALDGAEIMINHYGLEDKLLAEDFVREREEILDGLFPESRLMMGVERLLLHLHEHNVPMAIATSSHKRHFLLKTVKHKELFDKVFKVVITGDMVKESKPHPEIFQTALHELGLGESVGPREILVFEDAPLGVKAALAADMNVVMVNEVIPEKDLNPTQYLKYMLYFLPESWGLPPFS